MGYREETGWPAVNSSRSCDEQARDKPGLHAGPGKYRAACGVVVLANSRPYKGLVLVCAASLSFLWLVRGQDCPIAVAAAGDRAAGASDPERGKRARWPGTTSW